MRVLSFLVSLCLATSLACASGVDEELTGVFSNSSSGFDIVTLIVHKSGIGYLHVAVSGQIGDWQFDESTSAFSFVFFDSGSGKDMTVNLKFDRERRSYLFAEPPKGSSSRWETSLGFITKEIPDEFLRSFEAYPAAIKALRKQALARQNAEQIRKEQLERERPEYDRIRSRIKDDPRAILEKEFHQRSETPATRALRESLKDPEMKFPDDVLATLLVELPEDNHWIRASVFARPELSPSTIEAFYLKALVWGKLNYTILSNIATHANTPIVIVRDLASHDDLPVGATEPAKRRILKIDGGSSKH